MASKKKSWYAVKKGRTPGLYQTWSDCQKEVSGWPGAVFKGFYTREEAEAYLSDTPKGDVSLETKAGLTAYVDGSYVPSMPERYSYGVVFIHKGRIETESQRFIDPQNASMRNVAGEIAGAKRAMEVCLSRGETQLDLYYDYAGLEKWCTGEWTANLPGTKAFKAFYDSIKDQLTVCFHKVPSHTGVKYNEMADRLAKEALVGK